MLLDLATVREPKPLIVSSGENASRSMQSDSQASPKLNLRPFRRCRGIPIGDGNYTGCAYGDGSVRPFESPCDCPTCNGSGIEPRGEEKADADRIAGHRMRTSVEMDEIIAFVCSHCGIAVKSRTA